MGRFHQTAIPGIIPYEYEPPVALGDIMKGFGRGSSGGGGGKGTALTSLTAEDILPEHAGAYRQIVTDFEGKVQGLVGQLQQDRSRLPQVKQQIAQLKSEFQDKYFTDIIPMMEAKTYYDTRIKEIGENTDLDSNSMAMAIADIKIDPDYKKGRNAVGGGVAYPILSAKDRPILAKQILDQVEKDVTERMEKVKSGSYDDVNLKVTEKEVRQEALRDAIRVYMEPYAKGEANFAKLQGSDVDEGQFINEDGSFNKNTRLGAFAHSIYKSQDPFSEDTQVLYRDSDEKAKRLFDQAHPISSDYSNRNAPPINRNFQKFIAMYQGLLGGGGTRTEIDLGGGEKAVYYFDTYLRDYKNPDGYTVQIGMAADGTGPWAVDFRGERIPFDFDFIKKSMTKSESDQLEDDLRAIGAIDDSGEIRKDVLMQYFLGKTDQAKQVPPPVPKPNAAAVNPTFETGPTTKTTENKTTGRLVVPNPANAVAPVVRSSDLMDNWIKQQEYLKAVEEANKKKKN